MTTNNDLNQKLDLVIENQKQIMSMIKNMNTAFNKSLASRNSIIDSLSANLSMLSENQGNLADGVDAIIQAFGAMNSSGGNASAEKSSLPSDLMARLDRIKANNDGKM